MEAGGLDYMKAVLAEEQRCCSGIDKRIRETEANYLSLSNELNILTKSLDGLGFFAQWNIRTKMVAITLRMSLHRDVLVKLYDARWRRTYG